MKRLASSAAALLTLAFAAAPALAETSCEFQTATVSTVGSAITGSSSPMIWIVQQCVDDDGQVRSSVSLCEVEDGVETGKAAKCTMPAEIGEAVSKPQG